MRPFIAENQLGSPVEVRVDKEDALIRCSSGAASAPTSEPIFASMAAPPSTWQQCLKRSVANPYTAACACYILYALVMLVVDFGGSARQLTADREAALLVGYFALAMLHVINALQFLYAWLPLGYHVLAPLTAADHLNVISGLLYVSSAGLYYGGASYHRHVEVLEAAAAVLEVAASVGWIAVWAVQRQPSELQQPAAVPVGARHDSGSPAAPAVSLPKPRGATCRLIMDPDFWALSLTLIPSLLYAVYNISVLAQPSLPPRFAAVACSNGLFQAADIGFAAGAVMYMMSALRDDGWAVWLSQRGGARRFLLLHDLDSGSGRTSPAHSDAAAAAPADSLQSQADIRLAVCTAVVDVSYAKLASSPPIHGLALSTSVSTSASGDGSCGSASGQAAHTGNHPAASTDACGAAEHHLYEQARQGH